MNAVCHSCGQPVVYDHDSGCWIHSGFEKVDGRNGLYCSPEMWSDPSVRIYARPTISGASADRSEFIHALTKHSLIEIRCDHDDKTDVAICNCGLWASEPMASVQAAKESWASHVWAELCA